MKNNLGCIARRFEQWKHVTGEEDDKYQSKSNTWKRQNMQKTKGVSQSTCDIYCRVIEVVEDGIWNYMELCVEEIVKETRCL